MSVHVTKCMRNGGRYDAMEDAEGCQCHVGKKLENTIFKM